MNQVRLRVLRVLAVGLATAAVAACSEKLEGGAGCPALCPEQSIEVRDTVIDALAFDTSLVGFPPIGTETFVLLASHGDSLETRGVIRFDTLPSRFTRGGTDSAIYAVDSSLLVLRIDTAGRQASAPVTVEAYDVDTADAVSDTAQAALLGLFRPDRLLGSVTLPADQARDSIKVPLSNARLLAKITAGARLRVGLRATSTRAVELRVLPTGSSVGTASGSPAVRYDPSPDTAVRAVVATPSSRTPTDQQQLALDLTDITLVARSTATAPQADAMAVGGLPTRRLYMRFNLPTKIADSSTIVRATLFLTQRPNRTLNARDTITIYPHVVAAGPSITDLTRSAFILAPATLGIDSLRAAPGDSGVRSIEIAPVIRTWRAAGPNGAQRAIVLRAALEGVVAGQIRFFSSRAAPALRPRIRLSYVPALTFGAP